MSQPAGRESWGRGGRRFAEEQRARDDVLVNRAWAADSACSSTACAAPSGCMPKGSATGVHGGMTRRPTTAGKMGRLGWRVGAIWAMTMCMGRGPRGGAAAEGQAAARTGIGGEKFHPLSLVNQVGSHALDGGGRRRRTCGSRGGEAGARRAAAPRLRLSHGEGRRPGAALPQRATGCDCRRLPQRRAAAPALPRRRAATCDGLPRRATGGGSGSPAAKGGDLRRVSPGGAAPGATGAAGRLLRLRRREAAGVTAGEEEEGAREVVRSSEGSGFCLTMGKLAIDGL